MKYGSEIIERVRKMRSQGAPLSTLVQESGASKATVYSWIKDMDIPEIDGENIQCRARRKNGENTKGRDTQWKWRLQREAAYKAGWDEASELMKENAILRDFICIYIGEGHRRSKNSVMVANTDPLIISLCIEHLRFFSKRKVKIRLWCEKIELLKLKDFWADALGVHQDDIHFQEKKQVSSRRSQYGIVSVAVNDTMFRNRLQGWVDKVKSTWAVRPKDRT
jgi:hypothetical protein